jgi:hypothetical protein
MLNLTPHAITVQLADGTRITYPPSGEVARVTPERLPSAKTARLWL